MREGATVPEGYAAYGWHTYASGGISSVARLTVGHLVPPEQVQQRVRGGEKAWGPALCGRTATGRYVVHDSPGIVSGELERGERKPCQRCFTKAGVR